jgi:hypothetical protein
VPSVAATAGGGGKHVRAEENSITDTDTDICVRPTRSPRAERPRRAARHERRKRRVRGGRARRAAAAGEDSALAKAAEDVDVVDGEVHVVVGRAVPEHVILVADALARLREDRVVAGVGAAERMSAVGLALGKEGTQERERTKDEVLRREELVDVAAARRPVADGDAERGRVHVLGASR